MSFSLVPPRCSAGMRLEYKIKQGFPVLPVNFFVYLMPL